MNIPKTDCDALQKDKKCPKEKWFIKQALSAKTKPAPGKTEGKRKQAER